MEWTANNKIVFHTVRGLQRDKLDGTTIAEVLEALAAPATPPAPLRARTAISRR